MRTAIAMGAGTLIRYRLRVRGVPVGWLTAIREWDPPHRFVDEQLRGPYALWHHTHSFEAHPGGGTLMRDEVRYALPLGPLGELARRLFVARDVEAIFDFRAQRIVRAAGRVRPLSGHSSTSDAPAQAARPSKIRFAPGRMPGCSPIQDHFTVWSGPTMTSARVDLPSGSQ